MQLWGITLLINTFILPFKIKALLLQSLKETNFWEKLVIPVYLSNVLLQLLQ